MFSCLPVRKCQPAAVCGPFVAIEIRLLLLRREPRSFFRIDADRHHVVLTSRVERQHPQRAHQAVEHLRAEHRALVIHEREDDRPFAEVVAEAHVAARFIREREIERHLLMQPLIDPDLFQQTGLRLGRLPGIIRRKPLRARGRRCGQYCSRSDERRREPAQELHGYALSLFPLLVLPPKGGSHKI